MPSGQIVGRASCHSGPLQRAWPPRQHHALLVESSRRCLCRKFRCAYRSGKLGFAVPWLLGAMIVCKDRMTIVRTVLHALAVRCRSDHRRQRADRVGQ